MDRIITTFTDFGNRQWKDKLTGGEADDKKPEDFNVDDIRIGSSVEREHTSNPDIATEIAMDHLTSDNEYYDKLIASGLVDEEDAKILYDELKDDNDREKAKQDILDYIEEEDDDDDYEPIGDEIDDNDDDDDEIEEDELGTDKADIDDYEDEMIIDDVEKDNIQEKIKYRKMKDYNSFVNEGDETEKIAVPNDPEENIDQPGPERIISKENKYKFQLPYSKKVEKKLLEYSFTFYVPKEDQEDVDKNFIIIDIQNLTYSIVDDEKPGIRQIEESKLKFIFENL